jgi:hypothetical protein
MDILSTTATKYVQYQISKKIEAILFDDKIIEEKTKYSSWISTATLAIIGLIISSVIRFGTYDVWFITGAAILFFSIVANGAILFHFNRRLLYSSLVKTALIKQEMDFLFSKDVRKNIDLQLPDINSEVVLRTVILDEIRQKVQNNAYLLEEKDKTNIRIHQTKMSNATADVDKYFKFQILIVLFGILFEIIRAFSHIV